MVIFVLRDASAVTRVCSSRVFHVISRLSYGMYLNHFPILAFGMPLLVGSLGAAGTGNIGFALGYAFGLCASIAVSAVTFILIESPFLQLRDHWLATRANHRAEHSAALGDRSTP